MSNKQQQLKHLINYAKDYLINKCNAVKTNETLFINENYLITSPNYGAVKIKIDSDDIKRNRDASISLFIKFNNPELAIKNKFNQTALNEYSGKYNYHYLPSELHINYALSEFVDKY